MANKFDKIEVTYTGYNRRSCQTWSKLMNIAEVLPLYCQYLIDLEVGWGHPSYIYSFKIGYLNGLVFKAQLSGSEAEDYIRQQIISLKYSYPYWGGYIGYIGKPEIGTANDDDFHPDEDQRILEEVEDGRGGIRPIRRRGTLSPSDPLEEEVR